MSNLKTFDEPAYELGGLKGGDDVTPRLYNSELMIDEQTAVWLEKMAMTGTKIIKPMLGEERMAEMFFTLNNAQRQQKPYAIDDGIAIINIKGMLEHDSFWYSSYWTGYDAIRKRFDLALDDHEVQGVAFMVNTNGGQVSGNFDLADHIYSKRGIKPSIAIVNESAYSAGYSLASAAGKVIVNRTGGVGSVGVVTVHFDHSSFMERIGVKPTIIHAGRFKKDGNPYENLSKETVGRIQARIDGIYTIFVETVARNRSMEADAVRNTEAAVYSGEEAVSIGLADSVKSSADALAEFKKELSGSQATGGITMSTANNGTANAQIGQGPQNTLETGYTQTHLDQKIAEAKAEGAKEEHARITGILGCDEAKGRENSALVMANNTATTVEMAKALLAGLPESGPKAEGADDALDSAMGLTGDGPGVGAGSGEPLPEEQAAIIDTSKIYSRINNSSARH